VEAQRLSLIATNQRPLRDRRADDFDGAFVVA